MRGLAGHRELHGLRHDGDVARSSGEVELSMEDLRVVARFATEAAQEVLPLFERVHADDPRPRAAVEAARAFGGGARRTNLQRVTAVDAHRAAKEAARDDARHAALAAGDAAAAAYLHPIAKATQVGHILRAAAHAARATELAAGGDSHVGDRYVEQARARASAALRAVLGRYPPAADGSSRVAELMKALDTAIRAG